VLAYAVVSVAWIAFSDTVLLWLLPDESTRSAVATGKGIAFVVVTAGLIWGLLLVRDSRLDRGRRELEASEERHRMLSERSQDVVYRIRYLPEPGVDYVSPAIEQLTGHVPADFYADPALARALVHPEDRDLLLEAAEAGTDAPVLVRWAPSEGTIRWLEHRVTLIRDAQGRVEAIEGVARDVTARVQADADRTVLMQAIDGSPVGIALVGGPSTGFEITYANPALCALVGRPADQVVGKHAFAFAGEGGPALDDELAARLAAGDAFELKLRLQPARGGGELPASFVLSPVLGRQGELEGFLAFLQDTTEAEARSRAESMLDAAMAASPLAIVTMDLEGIVLGWNPAAEQLFGWSPREAIGRLVPYLDEEGWAGTADRRRQLLDGVAETFVVRPILRADGDPVVCHLTTGVIRDADGTPTGYVTIVNDLTDALRREEWSSQLRRAIDHAAEAVVITDLAGTITYVNPAFEQVSGYRSGELLGRNPRILNSGLNPHSTYEEMWGRLAAGETWRGMLVNRRKDGSLFEEEATLSAVLGPDGRPTAYVGVKRDLTLERRLAGSLNTELMDRAAVEDAMGRIEAHDDAEATAQSLCAAVADVFDIDDVALVCLPPDRTVAVPIAAVMTTLRMPLGEPIEPALAAYLRERAVGGPWSDNHAGGRVDARIDLPEFRDVVRVSAPIRHRGRVVAVLVASTHAAVPDAWAARHLKIVSELATHAGPILGPQLARHDLGRASVDELRRIIEAEAFAPVFQPVCDLATRRPIGWEALTRFTDGVAPAQRFADARAIGLGEALEIAAGRRAVEAFAELGHAGWLSVNLSPALVLGGHAPKILAGAGSPIVLELTEQVEIDDYARLRGAVDLLDPPSMLAVDDAGNGYASLRHVLELRPDFVKLDPSFVHDIDRNETRQAMIAGMVHYAAENDTRLIAEGIETEAERRTLLRLGVRYGQGYLLGVPSATGAVAPHVADSPRRLRALAPNSGEDRASAAG
jgi:PAS domain S-box-containing protein